MHVQTSAVRRKQIENDEPSSGHRGGSPSPDPISNRSEFNSLYATWYGEVKQWIRALGGDSADLDDLTQEVFVIVHRRLHAFDGKNIAGWLYRIAFRRLRDFRRLRWIKNVFKRSVRLSSHIVSPGPTPLMALETQEKQRLLERLLAELSERMRAAFVLFEIEGYTTAEIAILNRVSINTVRAQIHRARKKLFVLLEERRAIDDSGNDWNTCMIIADSRVGKTRDAVSASPSCQPLVD